MIVVLCLSERITRDGVDWGARILGWPYATALSLVRGLPDGYLRCHVWRTQLAPTRPGSAAVESTAMSETMRGYDVWAPAYDDFDNPMIAMVEHALDRVPLNVSGRRVVELGCGTGRNVHRVLQLGAESYVGIDGSDGMLARARERYVGAARVTWKRADVMGTLPLAEGTADDVLITLVLEHVEALEPVFRTVERILTHGGRCRIVEIHSGLVESGTSAHFWANGTEHRLASFPHPAREYAEVFGATGLALESICEWYASADSIRRSGKLAKHGRRPVVVDVTAIKP